MFLTVLKLLLLLGLFVVTFAIFMKALSGDEDSPDYRRPWLTLRWLPVLALVVFLLVLLFFGVMSLWWLVLVLVLVAIACIFIKVLRWLAVLLALVLIGWMLLYGGFVMLFGTSASRAASSSAGASGSSSSAPSSTAPAPADCATWPIKPDAHKDGNFISDGLKSIHDAKTDVQAKAAANDFVEKMKDDVGNLAFAISQLLHQNVSPSQLADDNGCATSDAASYVSELHDMVNASTVTPAQAPATGTNTGSANDVGQANSQPGVSGDRTAIKVVFPDGNVLYILARCANVVFPGSPPSTVPTTVAPSRVSQGTPATVTQAPPAPRTTSVPAPRTRSAPTGKQYTQAPPPYAPRSSGPTAAPAPRTTAAAPSTIPQDQTPPEAGGSTATAPGAETTAPATGYNGPPQN